MTKSKALEIALDIVSKLSEEARGNEPRFKELREVEQALDSMRIEEVLN